MSATPAQRPGRNEPCHCGSGRKYKQCCLAADDAAARAKAAEQAATTAPEPARPARTKPPRPQTHQPWKRSATNTHGFQRMSTPRKVGGS
jgi:hypothetical protein